MADLAVQARKNMMWSLFEKNLVYFIFCLFLLVLAVLLDYSYYDSSGTILSIGAFSIGIIVLLLNRKLFLYYLLTVFLLFDDYPKILYEPSIAFNSIGTVKVLNVSLLFWFFAAVSGFFLAWTLLRKKINVPSVAWPLVIIILIQFVSSCVYQIFFGDGITLQSLNSVIPMFLFFAFFIFSYNQSLKSNEIKRMFELFWIAFISKLLAYIVLIVLGRFIIMLGAIGQTKLLVFRNTSFNILAIFMFAFLIFLKTNKNISRYFIWMPVLLMLAVGIFLEIQRGMVLLFCLGILFYFYLYIKRPLVVAKFAMKFITLCLVCIFIAFFGSGLFNICNADFSAKLVGFDNVIEEIMTINIIGNTDSIRYVEFVNIFLSNAESIYSFFLGKGIGGYFEMKYAKCTKPGKLDLSDYTQDQINSSKFYSPHFFINVFLLKCGIVGLSFYFIFCYLTFSYFHKKCQRILYNNDFMSINILLFGTFLLPWLLIAMPATFKGNVVRGVLYGLLFLFCSKHLNNEVAKGNLSCRKP